MFEVSSAMKLRGVLFKVSFLAVLLSALSPTTAFAHALGWSYIFMDVTESGVSGRLELPMSMLKQKFELDADGNGEISDSELDGAWDAIEHYAGENFSLGNDGQPYPISFSSRGRLNVEITDYAVLKFTAITPAQVSHFLDARFTPFFEVDSDHRGGLIIENYAASGVEDNDSWIAFVFSADRESGTVDLFGESYLETGTRFAIEGTHHILVGIDHVLFLFTLLLTAVMTVNNKTWEPEPNFRRALLNLLTIVTLFTIAHTITLILASRDVVSLPSRWVESIIALSVFVVATNNLRPWLQKHIWILVFCFGLFHGLGFASVLQDLLLTGRFKLVSLIGFNVGVELGQIVIVIAVFPILFLCRKSQIYQRMVLPSVSVLVCMLALWWFVTRALGIESHITSF